MGTSSTSTRARPPRVRLVAPAIAGEQTPLTSRELEVLQLVASGATNGEIAQKLWVTEQTVKFHLSNVYRKLEVGNRTEASHYAHVNGLVQARGTGCRVLIRSSMGGGGRVLERVEEGAGRSRRDRPDGQWHTFVKRRVSRLEAPRRAVDGIEVSSDDPVVTCVASSSSL